MSVRNIAKLVASIVICEGVGGIGSLFTVGAIPTWYSALQKPVFTPPNYVFGPVWVTLYLLMAIAVFLVWRRGLDKSNVLPAFILFWGQLAVNILWSVVFFGAHSLFGGLVVIVALWLLILFNIIVFMRVSRVAGLLLVPYILWVSVATYLNAGVWLLNI